MVFNYFGGSAGKGGIGFFGPKNCPFLAFFGVFLLLKKMSKKTEKKNIFCEVPEIFGVKNGEVPHSMKNGLQLF